MDDPHCIPNTQIVVDNFSDRKYQRRKGCQYFLTHFHADHYGKLGKNWNAGPIYCSSITANLVLSLLEVEPSLVHPLPLDAWVCINDCYRIALVDANHCPGAVMILIQVEGCGRHQTFLHTGDCRYSSKWQSHPLLQDITVDQVFLDTTYCDPKYVFPPQKDTINFIADRVDVHAQQDPAEQKATLFLIATYSIGKERILMELARRGHYPMIVSDKKRHMLSMVEMDWPVPFEEMFSTNHNESNMHVVGWHLIGSMAPGGWAFFPDYQMLHEMLDHYEPRYRQIVAFIPTGWSFKISTQQRQSSKHSNICHSESDVLHHKETKGRVTVYTVPYSEHSNYEELRNFVAWLRPSRVVPTVLGGRQRNSRRAFERICTHFNDVIDKKAASRRFLDSFLDTNSSNHQLLKRKKSKGALERNQLCSSTHQDQNDSTHDDPLNDRIPKHRFSCKDQDILVKMDENHLIPLKSEPEDEQTYHKCQQDTIEDSVLIVSDDDYTSTEVHIDQPLEQSASMQIQTILGSRVTNTAITLALKRAKGNIQLAVNMLLDSKFRHEEESSNPTCLPAKHSMSPKRQKMTLTTWLSNGSRNQVTSTPGIIDKIQCHHSSESPIDAVTHTSHVPVNLTNRRPDNLNAPQRSSTSTEPNEVVMQHRNHGFVHKFGSIRKLDISPKTSSDSPKLNKKDQIANQQSHADHFQHSNQDCQYMILAKTFEKIILTKSRTEITLYLRNMLLEVVQESKLPSGDPDIDTIIAAVYLCTNHIAPPFKNKELGIGESIVAQAVRDATGKTRQQLRKDYKKLGDLGDVAYLARKSIRTLAAPKPLFVKDLYQHLHEIAEISGKGSQAKKQAEIRKLIIRCRGPEIRYLIRTLIANLRIGAVELTIQSALAHAAYEHHHLSSPVEDLVQSVKDAYARCPCWTTIVRFELDMVTYLNKALFSRNCMSALLHSTQVTPGIPVRSMLAKITRGLNDALSILGGHDFYAEFKYDGVRAQIHLDSQARKRSSAILHMFSRHLENITHRYPDALDSFLDAICPKGSNDLNISSCIIDAEIVAISSSGTILPFQTLMNRARKNVDSSSLSISVCVFAFDIMQLNGQSLLDHPFRVRQEILQKTFVASEKRFEFMKGKQYSLDDPNVADSVHSLFQEALLARCEGLMFKVMGPSIDISGDQKFENNDYFYRSTYRPSKRCENWLKVKKDYIDGQGDSLDLVVIGAWWGNGRKAGWFSPFLMACYDEETETYQTVCKVMSGFTDVFYKETTALFQEKYVIEEKRTYYDVNESMHPSVWFSPSQVWEIKGADFTVSPVHTAARGAIPTKPSSGISLRFPRFVRSREDKTTDEATTAVQIGEMYQQQTQDAETVSQHSMNEDAIEFDDKNDLNI